LTWPLVISISTVPLLPHPKVPPQIFIFTPYTPSILSSPPVPVLFLFPYLIVWNLGDSTLPPFPTIIHTSVAHRTSHGTSHLDPISPGIAYIPPSPTSRATHGDCAAMSTTIEHNTESQPANHPSPAPSAAGSTGTSGITVRTGPGGQPLSFRR